MEFSEYLQLDRMAHWPRFLRHPVHKRQCYSSVITLHTSSRSRLSYERQAIALTCSPFHFPISAVHSLPFQGVVTPAIIQCIGLQALTFDSNILICIFGFNTTTQVVSLQQSYQQQRFKIMTVFLSMNPNIVKPGFHYPS